MPGLHDRQAGSSGDRGAAPALAFDRPAELQASLPPELRGRGRDDVRLLLSAPWGHRDARFGDLPEALEPGDVLVVNRSATLPASLPARWGREEFLLNLSTRLGPTLWLAEPRRSPSQPGPLTLPSGAPIVAASLRATVLAPYPGAERLRFVRFERDPLPAARRHGRPISYGYLAQTQPLAAYQTIFADAPGSAEMPSAGRPFTPELVANLERRGVLLVRVTLHCGVSSLEQADLPAGMLYPEPFEVSADAAAALNRARLERRRLLAVGTTVVRALASAWDGSAFRPARGMTRVYVRPGRRPPVDGLLTGFHDPGATHLAMLEAVAGRELVEEAYRRAVARGYLWHEFGDSHLLLAA